MFEAGRRYSDSPVLGVSLGPVDATVLSTLVSQGFAVNDTSTVTTAPRDDSVNEFVRGPAPLGPLQTTIDPTTGAVINPVTAQPYLMPSVNGDVEIAIVLAGESKTLPSDGVVGYRLIVHDAIATGAVTIADDDGTYAIPVGSIGLFEFQSSGDVTLGNSSNTGGPITVLEIA